MTPNFLIFNTMTKQELLDYVSEKYNGWDNRKFVGKLKRIIFKNYSGKYIFYSDKKFEGNPKGIEDLYKFISE